MGEARARVDAVPIRWKVLLYGSCRRREHRVMRVSARSVFAGAMALVITACGTTASTHYGQRDDSDTDAADTGTFTPDVPTSQVDVQIVPRDVTDALTGHGPPYPIILHHGFAGFR